MDHSRMSGWSYATCYVLWIITIIFGLLDLAIFRMWIHEGYVLLGLNPWGFAAARNFSVVILAVIYIGGIFYIESYYRDGLAKRQLWSRFRTVTIVQLVPLVLTLVVVLYRRLLL